jgi:hypothetical protein
MASERKRSRRDEEPAEDDVPVMQPVPAEEPRGKAGAKKSAGGFPGALPIAAGAVAAALAFTGVFVAADKFAPPDPYESLDAGGVQAVRMLGVMDIDRWKPGFGTSSGVRAVAKKLTEAKKKEALAGDDKEFPQFDEALAQWYTGVQAPGTKFRMGLDQIFPAKDIEDEKAKMSRDTAIYNIEQADPGAFIGATILSADGNPLIVYPDGVIPVAPPGNKLWKRVGNTDIYDTVVAGKPAHWYQTQMHNRGGTAEGWCVVILSTASVKPFPMFPVAGAAAGLAFLGGLISVLVLAGGTKKALAQLAHDSDALARGHFDTRVAVGGPVVVQQIAKAVQKLAGVAQSGAAAPPQVMVQEVVRAPVQEINESLAPSKGFQRPEELEVEYTQKVSAEVGNDYLDVVNVDADHVGVLVADIPVHGVKSSMHMAAVRALFRANCKGQTSPAEVLKAVNRAFAQDLTRGVYVTAMYAVVNAKTGIVKVASAQHLPLVIWKMSKKASARLSPEGIALGLDPGPVFDKAIAEKAVQLEKGDRIMLFTDGAINGKNPAGAQYGDERFYYVVNKEAPKNSAACVNFVANDVDLFHEGSPLMDDFTIVTVRKLK